MWLLLSACCAPIARMPPSASLLGPWPQRSRAYVRRQYRLRGRRPGRQCRLGQRGDRSRHRRVRGGHPAPLVAAAGQGDVPRGQAAVGLCGRGWSNGYRVRAWKTELAWFAAEAGLQVTVCHFPPGTSKWNKIEHRLFSHISTSWRGRPLVSHQVIVELIAATRTRSGLRVQAELDRGSYPLGVKVSDRELAAVPLRRHDWHRGMELHRAAHRCIATAASNLVARGPLPP
jgi:hypothetical protein